MAAGSGELSPSDAAAGFNDGLAYLRGRREYAQALNPGANRRIGNSNLYLDYAIELYTAIHDGALSMAQAVKASPALAADPRNKQANADLAILSRIAWAFEQGAANFAQRRVDTARAKTATVQWDRYVSYLTGELPENAAAELSKARQAIESAAAEVGGGAGIGLVIGLVLAGLLAFGLRK
jgi:hypothetical protein